ncbi:MAG TPA: hypothetical protein VHT49_04005 [Acidimicrobiales bacterium]|nr:hypothetical protein [Acidimicrobiales bacterium]
MRLAGASVPGAGRGRRWAAAWSVGVLVAAGLVGCSSGPSTAPTTTGSGGGSGAASSTTSTAANGSLLAPAGVTDTTSPVDGISCNSTEQLVFHIHAHLAVYVDGALKLLPPGVGIGPPLQFQQTSAGPFVVSGTCFSWLHTHDSSGVIHIESPVQRIYTLGDFFDIWGQPLSATQVGPAQGTVTAVVNGAAFAGSPRDIPLDAHNVIQLDVGSTLPAFQPFTFPAGL